MKKLSILLGSLILAGVTYSAQLEVKAGLEPWREGKNSYADFDMGGSLGAEVLFNAENKPFDYGLGFEWKSQFNGSSDSKNSVASSEANAFPIYFTGKYGIKDNLFYLVGRAGIVIYDGSSSTNNNLANNGFYSALGIGKQFGAITLEALYESLDSDDSSKLYSGEQTNLMSIKLGYRFGENKREKISREAEEAARLEYERQQAAVLLAAEQERQAIKELEAEKLKQEEMRRMAILEKYKNPVIIANYDINNVEANQINNQLLNEMNEDLKNEYGIIEVKVYTDTLGTEKYNKNLSEERAELLANKIANTIENPMLGINALGLGEINFLNENLTVEERNMNRRAEVNFILE